MTSISTKTRFSAMVLAVIAVVAGLATGADAAGCLREFGQCGDCAEDKLWEGIRNVDLSKVADAYVDGLDCEIDLMHCILYAHHHSYGSCPA